MWPVRLRCRKITGFHGLGQHDAGAATHWAPCPPFLLPTHKLCAVHSLHRTQGWESQPVPTHRETVTTEDAELAADLLPSPSPISNARKGLSGSAKTPPGARWRSLWAGLCSSCPIPANRGMGGQGKSYALPLPQGAQNLPN